MKRTIRIAGKPALDLIEESVALLRETPLGVLALYYIGAVPLVLGFLFFWTDMSRGAFAADHLTLSALEVALLYVWCKCWQSLFCVYLLAAASRQPLPPWTWRRLWRLATAQAAIQPTSLFVMPVAAMVTLPIGYAFAFYQNVSILALDGAGEPHDVTALRREAFAETRRWPAQNHIGLAVLQTFGLAVFANVMIVILSLPFLLRTLLGIETMFSRSLGHWNMFNSTLFGTAAAITYLCVDPIHRAFYTMRCFHGRSLATGQDLRITLRAAAGPVAAAAAMVLLCCAVPANASMAAASSPTPAATARAGQLDHSISKVLSKPEFAWRMPREEKAAPDDEQAAPSGFMRSVGHLFRRFGKAIGRMFERFGEWLGRHMLGNNPVESSGGGNASAWGASLQVFAWLFCIVAAGALAFLGWKLWTDHRTSLPVAAQPLQATPDLTAEDVAADLLPGDEWLNIARQLIERGDLRLALRAFYLAALAHLGERQAISIARYKSNREYQRELQRRRPGETDLNATFADTVAAFERSWYGMHEVTRDLLDASQANLDRIRAC